MDRFTPWRNLLPFVSHISQVISNTEGWEVQKVWLGEELLDKAPESAAGPGIHAFPTDTGFEVGHIKILLAIILEENIVVC